MSRSVRPGVAPWLVVIVAFGLTAASCGDEQGPGPSGPPRPELPGALKATVQSRELDPSVGGRDLTALVSGNTAFALEIFGALTEQAPNENVALGPYSVSQAMAMLYAGARAETAEEMRAVLSFTVDPARFHSTMNGLELELASRNSDIVLSNANQTWIARGFSPNPDYLDVLTRDYGAPLVELDFAGDAERARATINDWVGEVTEQKIRELFPTGSIDASTVLVLTNAMYMDAPWKYSFERASTSMQPFTIGDGSRVNVSTMHYDDFLPSATGDGWQAVELPYRGDEVSMFVIVPEDLEAFEATLDSERLDEILGEIRDGGIHLSLPRFSYSFHASLVEPLTRLGLVSLFGAPDLSGIAGGGLAIQAVEHEAFVEVDEEGTRAAAATGVSIQESHGPTISVDKPFLFFVMDKPTGTVLFLGRVLDPRPG